MSTGVLEEGLACFGCAVVEGTAGAFRVEPGTALVLGVRVASGLLAVNVPEPIIVL